MDEALARLGQEQEGELPTDNPIEDYWGFKKGSELLSALEEKINNYNKYLIGSMRIGLIRNSYNQYYASQYHQGQVVRGGVNGEYRLLSTNHFRNLLEHILSQITQQKPAWQPKAINTDSKTQKQVSVSTGLCDYYMFQKHFDRITKKATEIALVCGHADVSLEWDASLGKETGADMAAGTILREGDVVSEVFDPVNSIFDFNYTDIKNVPWRILRRFVNKWDLMAKFPDQAEIINGAKLSDRTRTLLLDQTRWNKQYMNQDVVPVMYFYHKKTAALPEGRLVTWCSTAILTDGPLPYEDIPVYRIQAAENINNAFGHTVAFDLLPLQKCYDRVSSIAVTNLAYFGLSTIIVPKGGGFNMHPNIGGINFLEVDMQVGIPQALNFTSTPVEAFNFLASLVTNMQLISGVNDVNRGVVPPGVQSGAAMAMLASQTLVFNTPLAHSYADLLQDIGTGLVSIFKLYAKSPRLIEITGISNRSYLQEFTQNDLTNIFRVEVDLGSGLSKTPAGRMQIASDLLAAKQINGADYVNVMTSGNLNTAVEKIVKKQLTIRQENEDLLNGLPVRVLKTDDHRGHVEGHREVLDDPNSRRQNPESMKIQEAALAHIQEHIDVASQLSGIPGDMLLAEWLGLPSAPPPAGGPGPMGAPGGPMDLAGALPGNPAGGAPPLPPLPGMPNNPQTGEKFNTVDGGQAPLPA